MFRDLLPLCKNRKIRANVHGNGPPCSSARSKVKRAGVLAKKATWKAQADNSKSRSLPTGIAYCGGSINLIKPIHSPSRFGERRSEGKERVDRRNGPFANAKEFDFPCRFLSARALQLLNVMSCESNGKFSLASC